ncbi:hypothetical protein BU15DRAFT_81348 [Melanogaster broomeanus]|nr:hypothetical protein BU15DRAFT_81348 [Melanogaster broomeanus]
MPSSTFPAISRDRAGDRKNQGRPQTGRRPPGLRFTEPMWGLQQKSRRSGRSSLRYRPFFAVAGGSGCIRDHSSWVCNSCFVENRLAVVENDDDVLVQHPCSVPPTSTASPRRVCNPQFAGNGLVVVENDTYVFTHPPGPASLTSTASSRP